MELVFCFATEAKMKPQDSRPSGSRRDFEASPSDGRLPRARPPILLALALGLLAAAQAGSAGSPSGAGGAQPADNYQMRVQEYLDGLRKRDTCGTVSRAARPSLGHHSARRR
jgi:hypothetical protein